ncbi:hypothetical protein [Nocardioides euryhalodurans]|uniref:DUF4386 family protein n=1 Tax=Nocardioides euryhalodurans TaxID=2518370 RepID=A0A4P7GHV5_9ACTN|nr:hypothetical protein [Nocardioides euryhalodurans]QBR91267.1 hypothetical protein EXE57_02510 [Nocardioides euryhalodurans]
MTITPTTLTRGAAVAAVGAGLLFIGVQLGHPHLDADSIGTTEVVVRGSLKVLMAVLALVGITGMYLSQVRRNGVLGLVGYVVLATGYLLITCMTYVAAFVMPQLVGTDSAYVEDVITQITGGTPAGDIGLLAITLPVQDICFLAGGLVFGVALFRARVLARWATVVLAVGGVVTILLSVMPDAFYRLLAFPNGIALIGLGCSMWATTRPVRADTTSDRDTVDSPQATAAGVE